MDFNANLSNGDAFKLDVNSVVY